MRYGVSDGVLEGCEGCWRRAGCPARKGLRQNALRGSRDSRQQKQNSGHKNKELDFLHNHETPIGYLGFPSEATSAVPPPEPARLSEISLDLSYDKLLRLSK